MPLSYGEGATRNSGDSTRNSWARRLCSVSARLRTPTGEAPASATGRSATIDWTLGPKSPRRSGQLPKADGEYICPSVGIGSISRQRDPTMRPLKWETWSVPDSRPVGKTYTYRTYAANGWLF